MKRVGIFSGSFDPVHDGHISFAHEAARQCKLDKVFFLVEPRPRRKQGVRALEHRQAMVRLALQDEPGLGTIMVHQQQFTAVKTIPVLHERFKGAQLVMLMGEDFLMHLGSWPHVGYLVEHMEFAIGLRGTNVDGVTHAVERLQHTRHLQLRYSVFTHGIPEMSSTQIRTALRKGQDPAGLNRAVHRYIEEQGLYVSAE
jgi:nicotinate-nucleotide adenylyltransferase